MRHVHTQQLAASRQVTILLSVRLVLLTLTMSRTRPLCQKYMQGQLNHHSMTTLSRRLYSSGTGSPSQKGVQTAHCECLYLAMAYTGSNCIITDWCPAVQGIERNHTRRAKRCVGSQKPKLGSKSSTTCWHTCCATLLLESAIDWRPSARAHMTSQGSRSKCTASIACVRCRTATCP